MGSWAIILQTSGTASTCLEVTHFSGELLQVQSLSRESSETLCCLLLSALPPLFISSWTNYFPKNGKGTRGVRTPPLGLSNPSGYQLEPRVCAAWAGDVPAAHSTKGKRHRGVNYLSGLKLKFSSFSQEAGVYQSLPFFSFVLKWPWKGDNCAYNQLKSCGICIPSTYYQNKQGKSNHLCFPDVGWAASISFASVKNLTLLLKENQNWTNNWELLRTATETVIFKLFRI